MRLQTLSSIAFAVTLCVGSVGCSDDKPQQDKPVYPPPNTKALPFRMSATEAPQLPQAPANMAADTIVRTTSEGKPAIYSVESGHIVQVYKGDRTGKKEFYFKDYGRYQRLADSSVPQKENDAMPPHNTLRISTPTFVGAYEGEYGQGWRAPNKYEEQYEQSGKAGSLSVSQYALEQMGAKHIGDTTLNGYKVRIYRNDIGPLIHTLWIWREVALKEHFFAPYDDVEYWLEPVSMELGVDLPDSLFKFPKEYVVVDRPAPPPPSALPPPPLPEAPPPPQAGQ